MPWVPYPYSMDIVYRPILLNDFTESELDALERLILRARASELSEANRLDVLVGGGYSDRNFTESLGAQATTAREGYELLGRLYQAISRQNTR